MRPARRGRPKAGSAVYARAHHPSWRWLVGGEAVSLPWKEYAKGALKERLIRLDNPALRHGLPDAPHQRTKLIAVLGHLDRAQRCA